MLGSEGFKGDAKIKYIVDIPVGLPCVVITNFPALFEAAPLEQRLFHVALDSPFR